MSEDQDHIDGMGQAKEREIMERIYADMDEQESKPCPCHQQPAKSDSTPTRP